MNPTQRLGTGRSSTFVDGGGGVSALEVNLLSQGRLTLVSGDPAPIADQVAKSDVFFTPYKGDSIALYTGAAWELLIFSEISIALSGLTSGKNYDVFAYNSGGTLALELSAAWATDTTRTDALFLQDGIKVKDSDKTRRLVGTINATSATTTESSQVNRLVLNENNLLPAAMFSCPGYVDDDSSTNYTTTSTTPVPANGGTGAVLSFLSSGICCIDYAFNGRAVNLTAFALLGVGEDSASEMQECCFANTGVSSIGSFLSGGRTIAPSSGLHSLTLLIGAAVAGTAVYYADTARSFVGTAADVPTTYIYALVFV